MPHGQHVRLLRDLLGQGCAHAVSRGRAEASKHGVPGVGGGLQRGRHAAAVRGIDSSVGFASEEKDRWIGRAVFHLMKR